MSRALVHVVSALLLGSCAPAFPPPALPPPASPRPSLVPRATPSDDSWASATWEDRHDTMTFVVHPNMARLFQEHAQRPFPEMTCRTCHGADAESVQYVMPHGLPALDPAHLPDPTRDDERGRTTKFMIDEVTPKMAELLDVAPYDPTTKRGFGCFNCHPVKK